MGKNSKDRARQQAKKRAKKIGKRKETLHAKRILRETIPERAVLAKAPVRECLVSEHLFRDGIGHALLCRRLGEDAFAVAVFLLDVYCLGVKDAFLKNVSLVDYQSAVAQLEEQGPLVSCSPEHVCKLVNETVAFAQDLGFPPHRDYARAETVFGDLDPEACPEAFTFGKDGKPFYLQGPFESCARAEQIMATLTARLGAEGFEYAVKLDIGEEDLEEDFDEDFYEDFDEDEDGDDDDDDDRSN